MLNRHQHKCPSTTYFYFQESFLKGYKYKNIERKKRFFIGTTKRKAWPNKLLDRWRDRVGRKKVKASEYESGADRQCSEHQFVCSLMGWHWLRPAFIPWPHCQSSQAITHTHTHCRHTHSHTVGLSRPRVRLTPNYSIYLSSKHRLHCQPPGTRAEGECVELRRRRRRRKAEGKLSVGKEVVEGEPQAERRRWVDVEGWNCRGSSWLFSCYPPSLYTILVPTQAPASGGEWLRRRCCQHDLSTTPYSWGACTHMCVCGDDAEKEREQAVVSNVKTSSQ